MCIDKKSCLFRFVFSGMILLLFLLLTVQLRCFDVAPLGPLGSEIGFSTCNVAVRDIIGVNEICDDISGVFGILALVSIPVFAGIGVFQWIKRKRLFAVDRDLWILLAIYVLTLSFYGLFEVVITNYRPILEDGALAASYPSSHTLLSVVFFGTAFIQARIRIGAKPIRITAEVLLVLFTLISVVTRLLSGVHWLTDILGGVLLGLFLLSLYHALLGIAMTSIAEREQNDDK